MNKNPVSFWQAFSNDKETSMNFFKVVFGWDFNYNEETGIYHISAEDFPGFFQGGFISKNDVDDLPFLTVYIRVDDVDRKVKLVVENGGEIIKPPFTLANGNRICIFKDPTGVIFGMIQNLVFYKPCSLC
jgi:predicted enzyme related to lactoylglutathione lyase